jgi:hypothetical protein
MRLASSSVPTRHTRRLQVNENDWFFEIFTPEDEEAESLVDCE